MMVQRIETIPWILNLPFFLHVIGSCIVRQKQHRVTAPSKPPGIAGNSPPWSLCVTKLGHPVDKVQYMPFQHNGTVLSADDEPGASVNYLQCDNGIRVNL